MVSIVNYTQQGLRILVNSYSYRCRAFDHSQTLVRHCQHRWSLDLWDKDDPYQVLGVDVNATAEEIRSAYYTQSKLVHPDRLHIVQTDKPTNAEAFHRLSAAYSLLSDPNSRRIYDQQQAIQRRIWTSSTQETSPLVVCETDLDREFMRADEIVRSHPSCTVRINRYNPVDISSHDLLQQSVPTSCPRM
ncbi:hypothetical protein AHF37_06257 [Paragonimus kellicotti]|nr:hypothetical protein AHF37_06257 [Paragonimus kellicotti]